MRPTDDEDRCPLGANGEVANFERSALDIAGCPGANDYIAAAGIKRRDTHEGGFNSQFSSR